jgi:predicted nucleic-acid-binding Zn-ribbon protein
MNEVDYPACPKCSSSAGWTGLYSALTSKSWTFSPEGVQINHENESGESWLEITCAKCGNDDLSEELIEGIEEALSCAEVIS